MFQGDIQSPSPIPPGIPQLVRINGLKCTSNFLPEFCYKLFTFVLYTASFTKQRTENSIGMMSGERGGHGTVPPADPPTDPSARKHYTVSVSR